MPRPVADEILWLESSQAEFVGCETRFRIGRIETIIGPHHSDLESGRNWRHEVLIEVSFAPASYRGVFKLNGSVSLPPDDDYYFNYNELTLRNLESLGFTVDRDRPERESSYPSKS